MRSRIPTSSRPVQSAEAIRVLISTAPRLYEDAKHSSPSSEEDVKVLPVLPFAEIPAMSSPVHTVPTVQYGHCRLLRTRAQDMNSSFSEAFCNHWT